MALADLPDRPVEAVVVPDVEDAHGGAVDLRPWHVLKSIGVHVSIRLQGGIPLLLISPQDHLSSCRQSGEE
jgi:hypothetical protein